MKSATRIRDGLLALTLAVAGAGAVAAAPAASAASTACMVVDTNANHSYPGLQEAVNAAAAGDTLFVKGTCTGTTVIGTNLTISGHSASGAKTATLNGGGSGSVLTIDSGATVTLNTLIITDGASVGYASGGGIYNAGVVTLNGSTVSGNSASDVGGGVYNASSATVTLNGSTVTGNTSDGGGGGIYTFGAVILNGSSTVTGNTSSYGGGIFNVLQGSTVTMNGSSTITGNTASEYGGGIFDEGILTMNGSSTITGNTASDDGGGIYIACGTANGAVTGVNVSGNHPDDISGGC